MKEQVEICIQGGIAKNNVELDLLKVQAVYMIPALKDSRLKQRKRQDEELYRPRKKFDSILKEACDDMAQKDVICKTSGYTRDAKAYFYQYESKEYNG
ncbi:MAG: hypothetical protein PHY47_14410 [Lachnospiraceae bacterium]|nr:hypothetical protein [Lachnospiraceae bacterium]